MYVYVFARSASFTSNEADRQAATQTARPLRTLQANAVRRVLTGNVFDRLTRADGSWQSFCMCVQRFATRVVMMPPHNFFRCTFAPWPVKTYLIQCISDIWRLLQDGIINEWCYLLAFFGCTTVILFTMSLLNNVSSFSLKPTSSKWMLAYFRPSQVYYSVSSHQFCVFLVFGRMIFDAIRRDCLQRYVSFCCNRG